MAIRPLLFNVALKSSARFTQKEIPIAYTGDLDSAELQFTLTDTTAEELVGATVKVYLYTRTKVPYQGIATITDNVVSYVLTEAEGSHAGITHVEFEVTFTDGSILASPSLFISVQHSLNNEIFAEPFAYDLQAIKQEAEAELIIMRAQELAREANEDARELGEGVRNTTFTASEGSRALTFNNSEAARQLTFEGSETSRGDTFTQSEADRQTTFGLSETSRTQTFNQSEADRTTSFTTAEEARATGYTNDHSRAESDHSIATTDHNTASGDHTIALADHSVAVADHDIAVADHETLQGYDGRLTNVENGTGIADGAITTTKLADDSVTPAQMSFMYTSKNLLKTSTRLLNHYVQNNGIPVADVRYDVSDFIPVKEGVQYCVSPMFWGAYYDAYKNPLNQSYNTSSTNPMTMPVGTKYIRITMSKDQKNIFNEGTTLIPYEDPELEYIDKPVVTDNSILGSFSLSKINNDELVDFINSRSTKVNLHEHLINPFIKTKIHLFGDSITQGVGATGFSATGMTIPNTTSQRDSSNSPSWANLLKEYVNEHYAKDICVPAMYDDNIIRYSSVAPYADSGAYFSNGVVTWFTFTFTGTSFGLAYRKGQFGIFDVEVDGTVVQSIDCYASTETIEETVISGLTNNTHTVKILGTGLKNAIATKKDCVMYYFKLTKQVEIVNDGVGGYQSHAIAALIKMNTATDDNFVFYMGGTNDRGTYTDAYRTYSTCRWIIDWMETNRPNTKLIVMSANPCGSGEFENPVYKFHLEDVDNALRKATSEMNVPFISHYTALSDFVIENEKAMSFITGDYVHPNDFGYKLMFKNIMNAVGLNIKMDIA